MSDLVERVRELLPSVRRDLEALVRIESVGADPARRAQVQRSAQATADHRESFEQPPTCMRAICRPFRGAATYLEPRPSSTPNTCR